MTYQKLFSDISDMEIRVPASHTCDITEENWKISFGHFCIFVLIEYPQNSVTYSADRCDVRCVTDR